MTCSLDECDRGVYALGFCEQHYQRDYGRRWRAENRDRMNAQRRARYAETREQNLAKQKAYRDRVKAEGRTLVDAESARRSKRLSRYGITDEDYRALFAAQGSACAICRTTTPVGGWVTDHCHETRVVRGILCRRCNTGLGQFGDDPSNLAAALSYLSAQPQEEAC